MAISSNWYGSTLNATGLSSSTIFNAKKTGENREFSQKITTILFNTRLWILSYLSLLINSDVTTIYLCRFLNGSVVSRLSVDFASWITIQWIRIWPFANLWAIVCMTSWQHAFKISTWGGRQHTIGFESTEFENCLNSGGF